MTKKRIPKRKKGDLKYREWVRRRDEKANPKREEGGPEESGG